MSHLHRRQVLQYGAARLALALSGMLRAQAGPMKIG